MEIILAIIVILLVLLAVSCIKIVPQAQAYVVESLSGNLVRWLSFQGSLYRQGSKES